LEALQKFHNPAYHLDPHEQKYPQVTWHHLMPAIPPISQAPKKLRFSSVQSLIDAVRVPQLMDNRSILIIND